MKRPHQSPVNNGGEDELKIRKKALLAERRKLVIWKHRSRLLDIFDRHKDVILISSTGSGKTTQIPQFLLEEGLNNGQQIAVTQPRRVAAISIAERVAAEVGCRVGQQVGYKVRFEDATSAETQLKYLTDGALVREALNDPLLASYSLLILDEAHERTLQTDLLFGVLRSAREARHSKHLPPLRLIVMSATIDPDEFESFLGPKAVTVYLEGRQHPLQCLSVTAKMKDHVEAAIVTVQRLHREEREGDILCFLAGREEIERAARVTTQSLTAKEGKEDEAGMKAIVQRLYAGLPSAAQMKALAPTPQGYRKIIFSTNIAETSITIPGVRIVVDSGFCKIKSCHATTGMETLILARISQAQAWQRAGRAAREGPGLCLRLFTDKEYASFPRQQQPELMRVDLSSASLHVIRMGFDPSSFPFLTAPPADSLKQAVHQLRSLSATQEAKGGRQKLTALGRQMVQFPLDPSTSRVIIAASELGCAVEVISIVAMMSIDHLFYEPPSWKHDDFESARRKFDSPLGDFLSLLRIYREYKAQLKLHTERRWCRQHCLNEKSMKFALRVRRQLREVCLSLSLNLKSCGEKRALINRAFVAGFFSNTARSIRRTGPMGNQRSEGETGRDYVSLVHGSSLYVHPDSAVFHGQPPPIVIFAECVVTNRAYMRHVAPVEEAWIREMAPEMMSQGQGG